MTRVHLQGRAGPRRFVYLPLKLPNAAANPWITAIMRRVLREAWQSDQIFWPAGE